MEFVAAPVLTLLVAAGGYFAGTTRSAQASEALQDGTKPKICWHDDFSVWRCGGSDSTSSGYAPALASAEIADIAVTLRRKSGNPITFYVPATTDAIFLRRPPIESMLLRYYEGTRQRARANELRAELRTWRR
jgi:hypothetical protein